MTADLGARFGFEMRSLLLRKSQELSLHQFDEVGVSSMITRTTSDITNLQQTMGMVLQMVVPAPLIVGASIVMTAMVTPVMAVIQVGFMAALAAVAAVVLRKSNALSCSIQVRLDRINRVVREAVTGVRVIGPSAAGLWGGPLRRRLPLLRRQHDPPEPALLPWLFRWCGCWPWAPLMAAWCCGRAACSPWAEAWRWGQITAVTEYSILTMGYLLPGGVRCSPRCPRPGPAWHASPALLDTRPDVEDGAASAAVAGPGRPAVEFDHVSFSLPRGGRSLCSGISPSPCIQARPPLVIGSTGSQEHPGRSAAAASRYVGRGPSAWAASMCVPSPSRSCGSASAASPRRRSCSAAPSRRICAWAGRTLRTRRCGGPWALPRPPTLWSGSLRLDAPVAQGAPNYSGGQRQRRPSPGRW